MHVAYSDEVVAAVCKGCYYLALELSCFGEVEECGFQGKEICCPKVAGIFLDDKEVS